ncbi:MAG: hypothetical protein J0I40_15180, partial [Cellulomonas sp.]|nr:hypothetical protein [Cellulomonas sp.]
MAARDRIRSIVIDVPLPSSVAKKLADQFPDVNFAFYGDPDRDAKLAHADAYVHWNIRPETLAAAPNLRWYQSIAAGVDDDLIPEVLARNLIITNNSGVHATNMAEHVLAMMLAFARRLPFLFRAQLEGAWKEQEAHNRMQEIFELGGQTLL